LDQLKDAPKVFALFGAKPFAEPGFEADDLIATFAERFQKEKDLEIVILTGDLDTLQLVGGRVSVRAFRKGVTDTALYDPKGVEERYGLKPEQMLDYKILVGDVSDNVKGVMGIGPKTACAILQEYGSLKNALQKMEGGKIKDKLLGAKEQIEISRIILALRRDIPVHVELKELQVEEDHEGLKEFFKNMGFKALLKRLENGVQEKSQGQIF
jgi:DNA polymerase-1